jgi:hypothetical protein
MTATIIHEEYHCETCHLCKVKFWVPLAIHQTALIRCQEFMFWCPNGHRQHYVRRSDEDDEEDEGGEVISFPVIDGGKK